MLLLLSSKIHRFHGCKLLISVTLFCSVLIFGVNVNIAAASKRAKNRTPQRQAKIKARKAEKKARRNLGDQQTKPTQLDFIPSSIGLNLEGKNVLILGSSQGDEGQKVEILGSKLQNHDAVSQAEAIRVIMEAQMNIVDETAKVAPEKPLPSPTSPLTILHHEKLTEQQGKLTLIREAITRSDLPETTEQLSIFAEKFAQKLDSEKFTYNTFNNKPPKKTD